MLRVSETLSHRWNWEPEAISQWVQHLQTAEDITETITDSQDEGITGHKRAAYHKENLGNMQFHLHLAEGRKLKQQKTRTW